MVQQKLDQPPGETRSSSFRTNAALDRLINEAARRRGLSTTAYIRRAAAAIATFDLEASWEDAMADEPGFGLYGERPGRAVIRPDGHGFGPWQVTGLTYHFPGDEHSEPRRADGKLDAAS